VCCSLIAGPAGHRASRKRWFSQACHASDSKALGMKVSFHKMRSCADEQQLARHVMQSTSCNEGSCPSHDVQSLRVRT
jgi:hypothetical protein